jgi:hypothetical protein
MNAKRLTRAAILAVTCLAANQALACGEVMYRMGGALHYRAFITKHPAQILLYTGNAAPKNNVSDSEAFHHNLERAGHKVTVIDTPEALALAVAAHPYDVIIASSADVPAINAQLEHAAHEPSLIPVLTPGSDEQSLREHYPLALQENANLNQFLRTIEETMKSRGT